MSYTINPNAKNKWARNAENTMDLSLETDASSVYLDDGRTLEQELGEGSMVSNVATVDSSMSKVIDGTLNSAYESGVMYGRTLVNISKMNQKFEMKGQETSHIQIGIAQNQLLKPNTKYLLKFNYEANFNGETITTHGFYLDSGHGSSYMTGSIVGIAKSNSKGTFCHILTTKNEEKNTNSNIYLTLWRGSTNYKITVSNLILIEYQEGMENWDIPYFEGLCDVKMPILRNVGKNLFDGEWEAGQYDISGNKIDNYLDMDIRSKNYISVKPNKTYVLSNNGVLRATHIREYNINHEVVATHNAVNKFTTTPNTYYITGYGAKENREKFQIEESSTTTIYEDHKTNILHTPETVTLRSLPNGVRDTFNTRTGVYTQRIKEIVFDGSNDEEWDVHRGDWVLENSTVFYTYISGVKGYPWLSYTGKEAISDKIPSYPDNWLRLNDVLGMTNDNTGARKQFRIPKSYLETDNVDGFRKWLKQNPVTAYFELVTPITTTIEPLTIPFAYENGHIILESGFEGQSLLPTLEYSTVINRVGQIQSIANTIQKQEKQITKLEQMLIQNIIDLDYNNTLLTLKNEMEEML